MILEQWRVQRPDLDVSPVRVFGRISRIERHKSNAMREVYRRIGCDSGEYDVLAALRRAGPPHRLTPTNLARSMLVNSATMTERLTRLERRGLLKRRHSERDRRSVTVELTDTGRTLIDNGAEDLVAAEAELLASLTQKELAQLTDLLARLAGALDARV